MGAGSPDRGGRGERGNGIGWGKRPQEVTAPTVALIVWRSSAENVVTTLGLNAVLGKLCTVGGLRPGGAMLEAIRTFHSR